MRKPKQTQTASDLELTARAIRAWCLECRRKGGATENQSGIVSGVVRSGGLLYVTLHDDAGVLACYRVRNDGPLKRLRRWPREIAEE